MRIGVDLGGTKIEAVAIGADGQEIGRHRVPTPAGDYDGTVHAIADLVERLERDIGVRGSVGVGIPGALSVATGLVKGANSTCLIGRPLDKDLSAALDRPVRLANDANCFALSEAKDGAGAGARVVFGAILGTGVGGGIVIQGELLTGANAITGEWGHNPLPAPRAGESPGPDCYCGRRGCIEGFLSGPGFAEDHERHGGNRLAPAEIVALAKAGCDGAQASVTRYEERLARALGSVINVVDPDVIILGGGMSNMASLYQNVPGLWSAYVFSDRVDITLARPRHGDSSGVRGAAWLWPEGSSIA